MWLIFALAAPFFWALVHVLDEYCIDNVLERPWMGVVTSSLASIVVYCFVPFLVPYPLWTQVETHWVLMAFGVGILIQLSQFFYFNALSYSEAGIVAAYWNFVPAFLPLVSFLVYSDVLSLREYLGIFILIIASTSMCLLDFHHKTRGVTLFLMLIASFFQVVAYTLMTDIYAHVNFFLAYTFIISGLIFCGIVPLVFKTVRKEIYTTFRGKSSTTAFFLLIELANLIALGCAQMAIKLGDASLVAAVETTIPAFVFLLSVAFVKSLNVAQDALFSSFTSKMMIVGVMIFGVWLVS